MRRAAGLASSSAIHCRVGACACAWSSGGMLAAQVGSARLISTRLFGRTIMTSTQMDGRVIRFGPYEVTKQVFLTTPHSFALVNLKPLIPGHVLVCPLGGQRRLTDLTPLETTDLFTTVQLAQRLLARTYFPTSDPEAGSFTVAVQDGPEAGQTVPHVHVHIIPRTKEEKGNPDEVYVRMSGEEGNVGGALWDHRPKPGGGMPRIEDTDRKARTPEDMHAEADRYKITLREMGVK